MMVGLALWKVVCITLLLAAAIAAVLGYGFYRADMAAARDRFDRLAAVGDGDPPEFDHAMLDGLPEVAVRYLRHAIAPGTVLRRNVRLQMHGTFVLGTIDSQQRFDMVAEQILHAPSEFIWLAHFRSGLLAIAGYDGLMDGQAWMHFWMLGLFPVARQDGGADLLQSARARPTIESIWAPAALLPLFGARWTQLGPNSAEVALPVPGGATPLRLEIAQDGRLFSVETTRWSDANPARQFRWQGFGAIVGGEATFDGFTIPTQLEAGNNFGTPDYFPFFIATIDRATFGAD